VLEGRCCKASRAVELSIDLVSQDAANLASERVVVVIGRRVGGDEERRDPSDDPLAARASAPDGDATEDDHSDDDKPNDRGEGYSELHAGRRPEGRNIRRFWRPPARSRAGQ
jgi:hypothetical protein